MDMIEKFNHWWGIAKADSPLAQKNAVCISTLDQEGFPSGRFVDLKRASSEGFLFCSQQDSPKGIEISANPKVAMTAWWDHVGYQVRVKGLASQISDEDAQIFWLQRSHEAQLATLACKQSETLTSLDSLKRRMEAVHSRDEGGPLGKPDNWGGFIIRPISVEFFSFKASRVHIRERYTLDRDSGCWVKEWLEP